MVCDWTQFNANIVLIILCVWGRGFILRCDILESHLAYLPKHKKMIQDSKTCIEKEMIIFKY